MQPRTCYESELHRQHVRLRIPIQAEVDGIRYQVDDWSIGGFGVESVLTSRRPGERFPVKLIFAFDEFEMTLRFAARVVYADQQRGRFGCAFIDLPQQQLAVFSYLVEAYLSGEVVSAGDLLRLRVGDQTAGARLRSALQQEGESQLWAARLTRYGVVAAGLGGAVLLLSALATMQRYLP